jgi:hypothetical protein
VSEHLQALIPRAAKENGKPYLVLLAFAVPWQIREDLMTNIGKKQWLASSLK